MDKSKPEGVRIIQIATDHSDPNHSANIFGLGDDDIVYQWDVQSKTWYRYTKN